MYICMCRLAEVKKKNCIIDALLNPATWCTASLTCDVIGVSVALLSMFALCCFQSLRTQKVMGKNMQQVYE